MLASRPVFLFVGLLVLGLPNTPAWGQVQNRETPTASAQRNSKEWTEQYDQRFKNQNPLMGQAAPQAVCYDQSGKPFTLSKIRGKYAVLVFGCLT